MGGGEPYADTPLGGPEGPQWRLGCGAGGCPHICQGPGRGAGGGLPPRSTWALTPERATRPEPGPRSDSGTAVPWGFGCSLLSAVGEGPSCECGVTSAPACHPGTLPPRNLVGRNCWCLFRLFLCKVTSCLRSEPLITQTPLWGGRRRVRPGGVCQAAWPWARALLICVSPRAGVFASARNVQFPAPRGARARSGDCGSGPAAPGCSGKVLPVGGRRLWRGDSSVHLSLGPAAGTRLPCPRAAWGSWGLEAARLARVSADGPCAPLLPTTQAPPRACVWDGAWPRRGPAGCLGPQAGRDLDTGQSQACGATSRSC